MGRNKKVNFDVIRTEFEINNLILLSDEYNSNTPLKYKCPKHPNEIRHIWWYNFYTTSTKCKDCEKEDILSKLSIEFENLGYTLLEESYINCSQSLKYICNKHPNKVLKIRIDSLRGGRRCRFCAKEKQAKSMRTPFEKVVTDFSHMGYILLETEKEYSTLKRKMKCICVKHPQEPQYISYLSVKRGHEACKLCMSENRTGENSPVWKGGIRELSEYLRDNLVDWKKDSLEKYGYKCFITEIQSSGGLEIHHTKPFHQIRDLVIKKLNIPLHKTIGEYSQSELELILSEIIKLHNDVEGIPMLGEIHRLFHKIYGRTDISVNHVHEFKERYLNGEFNDVIKTKEFVVNV